MTAEDPLLGSVLNETYRVVRLLGAGAMGEVYLVTHVRLKRSFAMKVLKGGQAASQEAMARFQREAEITSAIGHPNIVDVVDVNRTEQGAPYLVMELLEGDDLAARLLRCGKMEILPVVNVFSQIASALQAAHDKGVVHRDLKPQNIMLCTQGERTDMVKVLDFGISKILGDQSLLTHSVAVMGTPGYMSPEQAEERSAEADARSDIFALGAVAYHMLSGQMPFTGSSVPAVLYKVATQEPPPLEELRPDLPEAVCAAIATAMRKDPAERFTSVQEFRQVLAAAAGLSSPASGEASNLRSTLELTDEDLETAPFEKSHPASLGPTLPPDAALASTIGASVGEVRPRPRPHPLKRPPIIALAGGGAVVAVSLLVMGIIYGTSPGPSSAGAPGTPRHDVRLKGAQVQGAAGVAIRPDAATPATPDSAVASTRPTPDAAPSVKAPPKRRTKPRRKHVKRRKVRGTGTLRLSAFDRKGPVNAAVFANRRRLGNSPVRRQLAAGQSWITVKAGGYYTWKQRVFIAPNKETKVPVRLKPKR